MARHRGSLTFRTPASFNSNNFRGFRSAGTMPSRFDHSAVAHKSAVSTRWFSRFVLLPVLSCASLHSFSSLLVFWIPVFQVLWISIARLVRFVRARDYWAVTVEPSTGDGSGLRFFHELELLSWGKCRKFPLTSWGNQGDEEKRRDSYS